MTDLRTEQGTSFEEAAEEARNREGCTVWQLPTGGYLAATYTEAEELPEDSVEVADWDEDVEREVTKAQPIKAYKAPQYLVEPQGPPVGEEALAIINGEYLPEHLEGKVSWETIENSVRGWDDYNAIIRLHIGELEWDYLAKVETEEVPA